MEKVTKFLEDNTECTIATCADDKPRASIVGYVMIEGNLIFATDPDSIKANNLNVNNKISLSICRMPQFVVVDGTTADPTDKEKDTYNKVMFERSPELKQAVETGEMHPFHYYKLVPEIAYYNDYSNGMGPAEIIKI